MEEYNTNTIFENDPINDKGKYDVRKKGIIAGIILSAIIWIFVCYIPMYLMESVGKKEFVVVEGVQIPTLYKYTGYDDVLLSESTGRITSGKLLGSYTAVFYNHAVPQNYYSIYAKELINQGYENVIYNGDNYYVLNFNNNNNFIFILFGKNQVKYGVCLSGRYENILK